MNFKLPVIAAFVAVLSLSACGGGGGGSSTSSQFANLTWSGDPAALKTTDTTVGTGAVASAGKTAVVTYTGWLYNDKATDLKGSKFDSGTGLSFTVGGAGVIKGFTAGVAGMKVGGKRTILIPSNQGYGATGSGNAIPPNAGLVFEVELTSVQ
jgi:FKBP-type peptidyl-prolyl cis-trans isomerase FkpA